MEYTLKMSKSIEDKLKVFQPVIDELNPNEMLSSRDLQRLKEYNILQEQYMKITGRYYKTPIETSRNQTILHEHYVFTPISER
jgi:hypothetical protein